MCIKMVTFKKVFDKYSELGKARNEDSGHKEAQVRDKLMEVVDAVGIDVRLLRGGDKFNSPLEIPETSVAFLVDVLQWHTSAEGKSLRRGAFLDVPVEKKEWLIGGFLDFLKKRDYDEKEVEHQRHRMEHRMRCSLQKNLNRLSKSLNAIHANVCKLDRLQGANFTDEDQILFADFAEKKVTELANYLSNVAAYLDDGRSEEIYEAAEEDWENSSDAEIMERELRQEQVYKKISKDKRYKELEQERDTLIDEEDFVKKKKPRYQQIVIEMQEIANGYEKEIFGDILPDEPEPHLVLKPPYVALAEAIAYEKEVAEERKKMSQRPPISYEEKERMRQCFIKQFGEDPLDFLKGDDDGE